MFPNHLPKLFKKKKNIKEGEGEENVPAVRNKWWEWKGHNEWNRIMHPRSRRKNKEWNLKHDCEQEPTMNRLCTLWFRPGVSTPSPWPGSRMRSIGNRAGQVAGNHVKLSPLPLPMPPLLPVHRVGKVGDHWFRHYFHHSVLGQYVAFLLTSDKYLRQMFLWYFAILVTAIPYAS